jgi:hypothetical protein
MVLISVLSSAGFEVVEWLREMVNGSRRTVAVDPAEEFVAAVGSGWPIFNIESFSMINSRLDAPRKREAGSGSRYTIRGGDIDSLAVGEGFLP